jgi:hypothetical protein
VLGSGGSAGSAASTLSTVSSAVSSLAAALRGYGIADDAMARRILRDCQSHAPTCTVDEVVTAVEFIGESLGDNVRSPIAVVRSQVPKLFESGRLVLPQKKEPKMSDRDRRAKEAWDLIEGTGKWAKK